MIPISPKLILYGFLAAGVAYGLYDIKSTYGELKEEKEARKNAELSRDTAVASLGLYQENNERQVKIINEYQGKLDEKQAINSQLERDVAANRKRLSIKGASCPASSTTANSGATEAASISDPDARSAYFRLRNGIDFLESNYSLCLKILQEDRTSLSRP